MKTRPSSTQSSTHSLANWSASLSIIIILPLQSMLCFFLIIMIRTWSPIQLYLQVWAPLVDSIYSKRFGHLKIPIEIFDKSFLLLSFEKTFLEFPLDISMRNVRFGRRKSWLVPAQLCIGCLFIIVTVMFVINVIVNHTAIVITFVSVITISFNNSCNFDHASYIAQLNLFIKG